MKSAVWKKTVVMQSPEVKHALYTVGMIFISVVRKIDGVRRKHDRSCKGHEKEIDRNKKEERKRERK